MFLPSRRRSHGRDLLGLLVGDDRVLDRVLQLRLVEVDGHVDLLGVDHLRQTVGRALDQQAVGPPRPAPVQVADVHQ